jgi:chromosome segregation ATPase
VHDTFEERLTAVEEKAELWAALDRDLADLGEGQRANTALIQALRETQIEQGGTLDKHTKILGELTTQVTWLGHRFTGLDAQLGALGGRLDRMSIRLNVADDRIGYIDNHIAQVDWKIAQVDEKIAHVDEKLDRIVGLLEQREKD